MGSKARRKKRFSARIDTLPYLLVPFLMVICLVPLVVFLKDVCLSGSAAETLLGQSKNMDFFSYYKSRFLIVLAVVLGLALTYMVLYRKQKLVPAKAPYMLLGTYAALAALSTLFSDSRSLALTGFADRYEGFWVLAAYSVVLLAGMNIVRSERSVKILLMGLVISATIMSLLGISQFIGQDFLASTMGRKLIIPGRYESSIEKMQFNFDKGTIYGTLYNTNYVGSYMVLVIPLALALMAAARGRRERAVWAVTAVISSLTLLGSNSRAGYLAAFVTVTVFVAIRLPGVARHWKLSVAVLACLAVALTSINLASSGWLFGRFGSIARELGTGRLPSLQAVELAGDTARLIFREEVLHISSVDDGLVFSDSDGELLGLVDVDGRLRFLDERYEEFSIAPGAGVVRISRNRVTLWFGVADGSLFLCDRVGEPISDAPVEAWGFIGRESLGSSRGYIWSRTLPLVKETVLLGHGPDTFALHFPQHDYLGKAQFLGDMNRVVDKPHNMYLQTAVQTGLLSLIALLGVTGMYAVDSLRLYARKPANGLVRAGGTACFLGVVGYLVAGVFNDSVVSVAPVFWAVLGMGSGINYLVKQEMAER